MCISLASELKVFYSPDGEHTKSYYLKSEADKVIAEKDAEIAGLKEQLTEERSAKVDYKISANDLSDGLEKAYAEIDHHKHKRCLAMAEKWREYAAFCGMQSYCHNHRGFGKTAAKWTWKECHAWKCVKRWLSLAEKFKVVR